jgi:hypothetical protein
MAWYNVPVRECRSSWASVWDMLLNAQDESERKLLVKGATGSGKSVFLAATAEMLRQRGWCAPLLRVCMQLRCGARCDARMHMHAIAQRARCDARKCMGASMHERAAAGAAACWS